MKTKTKLLTKLLTVFAVLSFAFVFCLMAITWQPNNAVAETADEKYNLYCVYDRYSGYTANYAVNETETDTASTRKITDRIVDDTNNETNDGYILEITCNQDVGNAILRCNIPFTAGVKYTISFKAKCQTYTENSTWNIWSRVMVNYKTDSTTGAVSSGYLTTFSDNDYKAKGNLTSWTTYSYEFTPTEDSTVNYNLLDFVVTMKTGDVVLLSDIRVEFSASHFDDKKDIVANSALISVGGSYDGITFASSESIYTVTANSTFTSLKGLLKFDTYEWVEGATYEILFKVKTSAGSKFNISSVQAKVPGKADTVVIASSNLLAAPDGKTAHAIPNWKTVYAKFSYNDKFATDSETAVTNNIFMLITGANQGDICYIMDMHVYANVSTVTVSENGKTTSKENVLTGSEYTLPAHTATEGKAFVGWDVNGKLYQTGDSITVNGDTSISAVAIEYATAEGAYLRLSTENPGMRFSATVDKTAVENALSSYGTVTGYGMCITSDDVTGHLDIPVTKWSSDTQKGFVCAVTGFEKALEEGSDFYNVKFKATAYVTVTLNAAEGEEAETITVYANTTEAGKSIVDMAKACREDTATYNALSTEQKSIVDTFADYTASSSQGGN